MWCAVAIIANAARRDNSKFFMMKSLWSSKVLENASCASMAWNFERILAPHPCSQNKSVTERLNSAMLTSTVSNWCSTVTDCSLEDIVSSSPNARNWFRIECQRLSSRCTWVSHVVGGHPGDAPMSKAGCVYIYYVIWQQWSRIALSHRCVIKGNLSWARCSLGSQMCVVKWLN